MNMHSTETLDQTSEMRLLTDAELNEVNGAWLYLIAAVASGGFSAYLTWLIMSGKPGQDLSGERWLPALGT